MGTICFFNPADEAAGSSTTPGSVIVPPYDSSKIKLFCMGKVRTLKFVKCQIKVNETYSAGIALW